MRPSERSGLGLVWALMGLGLVAIFMNILWSQNSVRATQESLRDLEVQSRFLGQGALAHGLHKVEKTVAYFDARFARNRAPFDVGKEDPAFLEDLTGALDYPKGRGSYRVVTMVVEKQKARGGGGVLRVQLEAETRLEVRGQVRRDRHKGDFRLFSEGGGP